MLLQCTLSSWVCLFILSCRKIIKGCFIFYCLEFVCTLGSGGAMCLGCVERSTVQLSIVARVLASPLWLALFVQVDFSGF